MLDRCDYVKAMIWGEMTWVTSLKSVQRWPVDTQLVHRKTGLELIVIDYELQGYYLGNIEFDGEYLKRYMIFPVYKVRIPRKHADSYIADYEMREP